MGAAVPQGSQMGQAALALGHEADGHRMIVQALRLSNAFGNVEQEVRWALENLDITQARIDESVKRVLLKKLALGNWNIEDAIAAQTTQVP